MNFAIGRRFGWIVLLVAALAGSLKVGAATGKEKMTALPMHDGLTFQQEVDSPVCGTPASIDLYDAPSGATADEYLAWYKQHLTNFHYVHKVWSNRAQELFYSPNGSAGVGLTASVDGKHVFSVSYLKFSSKLTTQQEDLFSPSNPTCK